MLILSATQNTQPDYVALIMVLVLAVIVVIMAIRKKISAGNKVTEVAPIQEVNQQKPAAPGSAGQLKLHDVEPKTAAMLMAIVADKMGKPLNELRFISIKEGGEYEIYTDIK